MITPTTTGHQLVEDVELVRQRVSRLALTVLVATLALLALRVVVVLVTGAAHRSLIQTYVAVGGGLFAALWLATRTDRGLSIGVIRALEAVVILGSGTAFAVMSTELPLEAAPEFVLLFTLILGLMLRAVLVPSTVARTLVFAALLYVPFLGVVLALGSPPWFPHIVFMSAFWVAGAFVTVIASHVVYGLHRDIHRARRLGQYVIERQLGRGGMGIVYLAHHGLLKRPTAVKVLRPEHASGIDIARFEREVQLTAQLTHPNTVKVYDYGRTQDGLFYYAMELLEGISLAEVVIIDGPQPARRVVHILIQVAGALAEAHRSGLIHRDIKPSNVLLVEQGGEHDVAKVVDFGLVKQLDAPSNLTADNALLRTPHYLAPEAIHSPTTVDARVDIYAFGALAYHLLTASDVFDSSNIVAVCSDHLYTEPQPPSLRLGKPIPADLEALVLRCLAKDPKHRPQSAEALLEELEPLVAHARWTRADGAAWWAAHREAIEKRKTPPPLPSDEAAPSYLEASRWFRTLLRASLGALTSAGQSGHTKSSP